MNNKYYKKLVAKYTPNETRLKNSLYAFITGGTIGVLSTFIYNILLNYNISESNAKSYILLGLITLSSVLTALGIFDNLVSKLRCGLIIPITGFAHSVTSSAIEYKKDGLITGLGSNIFKLAGSVLLYGMITSFLLTIIEVLTHA